MWVIFYLTGCPFIFGHKKILKNFRGIKYHVKLHPLKDRKEINLYIEGGGLELHFSLIFFNFIITITHRGNMYPYLLISCCIYKLSSFA